MSLIRRIATRTLIPALLTLAVLAGAVSPAMPPAARSVVASSNVGAAAIAKSADDFPYRLFMPTAAESAEDLPHRLFVPVINNARSGGPTGIYGVQMFGLDQWTGLYRLPGLRARWIRQPILWSDIEPANTTPGSYNWAATDAMLSRAAAGGYTLLLTVVGVPTWTGAPAGGPITSPAMIDEFKQFVTAMVQRYGQPPYNVKHWELFNEPDNGDPVKYNWLGGSWGQDPTAYANMLKAIYPTIKAADPQAKVVFGGVAHDWFTWEGGPFVQTFIEDVLKAGGGPYFDAMGFHYYPAYDHRWTNLVEANALRNLLANYGYSGASEKALICAEAGWWSNGDVLQGDPSSDDQQSRYLVSFFLQGMEARLDALIWYSLLDAPDQIDGREWGLIDTSRQPKPSYAAYKTLVDELGVATFLRTLTPAEIGTPDVAGKMLRLADNSLKTVYWSTTAAPQTVWLQANEVRLVELYGAVHTVQGAGALSFQVGQNPVYVQVIR